jgi:DNA-binding LacI/PurR family transcriptional regulator
VLSFTRALDREGTLVLDLSVERLEGYKQGLGNAWEEGLVRVCRPNAQEPARRAARELLRLADPPTAILAMSDVLAIGALQAAAELDVSVPGELSLVGFDDNPAAASTTPPLTTVAQPHEEKGRLATERLLDAIDERAAPENRLQRDILPTELVVRKSTGVR